MSNDPNQPQQPYPPQGEQPQNGYAQPQQGYAQPQQGYAQPQQGYAQPQQGYAQPQGGYVPPQGGYVPPQGGYVPPQASGQQAYPPGWAPQGQQMAPQYGFTPRHKLPGTALAAAIIWIIYGSLQLLGVLASFGMGARPAPGTIIGLGLGIAFLMAGIQTSTGKAKGLLANGIVSIVLGAIIALALLALGSLVRGFGGGGILLLLALVFGGMLVTAGILACVGNKNYKEFHHTKYGGF
jgi:hypothetical protein